MLFPEIPENLSELSLDELRSLASALREAGRAFKAMSRDERRPHNEAAIAAKAALDKIEAMLAADEAADAAFTDDPDDGDSTGDEDGEDDDADDGDGNEGDPDGAAAADVTAASAIERRGTPTATQAITVAGVRATGFLAVDGVKVKNRAVKAGTEFASFVELADAMLAKAKNVRVDTSQKHEVAVVRAEFNPALVLSENPIQNLAVWDAMANPRGRDVAPELTAAFCAGPTPIYDLDCENTTRRPFKTALPNFSAPRAAVSIYPSPSLSDIAGTAVGIWTSADDDDEEAVKGPCATITCGTPDDYEAYGVWACMTVKNLLTLNYPELIAQYLNRLAAAHARLGEIQLLNAAATTATPINAGGLGYGSATTITTQLMTYLALYREQQRWDDQMFDLYAHRWLQTAIRLDLSRRNRDGTWSVATEAQANQVFTDAGFDPVWFIDQPAWSDNLPASIATGGVLNELPQEATVLVAPKGKYGVIDRGELTVGVTGNNIYRDNASNERNQFTYFFENFEGIVDSGCAPSHLITFGGLCHSGYQIADVDIDCNGLLMPGDRNQDAFSS
jgi:hypothetical protein